jgi:hypothetical protein
MPRLAHLITLDYFVEFHGLPHHAAVGGKLLNQTFEVVSFDIRNLNLNLREHS